ncbi:MAG: hypothetical protein ACD_71C00131G0002 [uncultured bacterium (gcode 4)]|uniref:Uncharacterized protein n=1 Tax=uncultured bacterium (gcode 4) TaxID=1234023 RepID=K1Z4F8_9BACT|nr:MAG: hypothetical protein ACD_71C00131G0002 [uncultured bacterium (gcode 4)]
MVGGCIFMDKIKSEDILYCAIDKLGFDFESSSFDLLSKQADVPFKSEIIPIGKSDIEFEMYTTSVALDNYNKKIAFKIKYGVESYEVIDLFYNHKQKWFTWYLHWKIWRMANSEDGTFSHNDLLDFIQTYFIGVRLKEIHICLDVRIWISSRDFIRELDEYIWKNIPKISNGPYGPENKDNRREITIWKKAAGNKEFFYKIYDKKLEIKNHQIENFYNEYISDPYDIMRFEMEIRKDVAPTFKIEDLRSNTNKSTIVSEFIFNLLISYFTDKKHLGFLFEDIMFGNIKIKRQGNLQKGWIAKRIDDADELKNLKGLKTRLKRLDDKTGASFSSTIQELDKTAKQAENYPFFLSLYRSAFHTIEIAYGDWKPKDFEELLELIKWATQYTANFAEVSSEEFYETIRWWINKTDESLIKFLDGNEDYLIELMYFYYEWKYRDPIFSGLMDVIEVSKMPVMMKYFVGKKRLLSKIEKKVEKLEWNINELQSDNGKDGKEYLKDVLNVIFTPNR